jgi:cysteinyl-tRNA synthetase
MIKLIETLVKKGFAYQGDDKSIYFDISKFQRYGLLSDIAKRELKQGARIAADEYNKKNAGDFVLWKAADTKTKGEAFWDSPFGKGRPGWHIECSAMSMKYLGETFDIHAGAVDLLFPHHENEIAQSESATDKKFVNYWVEGEHLLVDGRKMAKSLGNFYTLQDIEKRGINPLAFRYLVLNSHYRSKLNFTWRALEKAGEALSNLQFSSFKKYLKQIPRSRPKEQMYEDEFTDALNDDLNTPKALKILWQLVRDEEISQTSRDALVKEFDKVLGLDLKTAYTPPKEIVKIAKTREEFRNQQKWEQADALRQKAEKKGWILEDTPRGPAIRRKL